MPVMDGTRLAGVDGGYPAQPDADAVIRAVDMELITAMDLSVPLLTLVGGLSSFTVDQIKYEWQNGDNFRRKLSSHGGLAATDTTAWTMTGQAHRYPVGSLFELESELVRITAHVDANTVTVARGQQGTTAAIHANTVVAYLAGASMHEGDNWVYRPTPTTTFPYNFCQLDHTALRNTWTRQSIRRYSGDGASELDKDTADTLAQKIVAIEGSLIRGQRHAGSASSPASAGGIQYFITSGNGADVTDKQSAALQWSDIYNAIDRIANVVGEENVGRTIAVDPWGREKINGFFSGMRRMDNQEKIGGSIIEKLLIEGMEFNLVTIRSFNGLGNLYILNTSNIQVGHLGSTGQLHVGEVMQNDGPFSGRYVYSHHAIKVKNIPTMGRIHSYSLTT